jgi:hypothetical protein
MTLQQARSVFSEMMQLSQRRRLTAVEHRWLRQASQILRAEKRGKLRNPRKKVSARKARIILHHKEVKGYPLTARQRRFFGARASGYPVRRKRNVAAGFYDEEHVFHGKTKIYGKVLRIEAQKTGRHFCDAECKRAGHKYYHDFRVKPTMYGLPNGDILIKG